MKQPLSLLVAAVAATACAPAVPAGEFRIVGKIENVPDGAVVRLYEPQGQMLRGIGVDTLAGGRFSFRDTVAFPKVVQISVTVGDYRGGTLDVWVAPANVSRSVVRISRLGFGRPLRTLRSRRTKTCTVLWSNLKSVS